MSGEDNAKKESLLKKNLNNNEHSNEYGLEIIELRNDIIHEYFCNNSNILNYEESIIRLLITMLVSNHIIDGFEEVKNEKNNFIVFDKYSNVFSSNDWNSLMKRKKNCSFTEEEREMIISSLELGIPDDLREKIWKYLSKIDNLVINHKTQFYQNLFKIKNKRVELEIIKDVERSLIMIPTINHSEVIKEDLYNILKAYSIYDPEIRYAQGTNFIVLTIILNVKSQVDAFWLFVEIMMGKNWRGLFLEHTPKLLKILDTFVNKLSLTLPHLYSHFKQENFIEQMPGTFAHYFTTLCSYNLPQEFSIRIFDLFWLLEENIIIDTLIEMMKNKSEILVKKTCDELHLYLKKSLVSDNLSENCINNIIPKKKKKQIVEKEIVIK